MISESEGPVLPNAVLHEQAPSGRAYVGVLKEGSPLLAVFGGRCIPLRSPNPSLIAIQGRFNRAILVYRDDLAGAHWLNLVEWMASRCPAEGQWIRTRFEALQMCALSPDHFSGIVGASTKEQE